MRRQPGAGIAMAAVFLAAVTVATVYIGLQWLAIVPGSLAVGYGALYIVGLPE